jgi:hypothetical protein
MHDRECAARNHHDECIIAPRLATFSIGSSRGEIEADHDRREIMAQKGQWDSFRNWALQQQGAPTKRTPGRHTLFQYTFNTHSSVSILSGSYYKMKEKYL